MAGGDSALWAWLAAHHGVVTTPQLYEFGLTYRQVRYKVTSGTLIPMTRGVYRSASHPETDLQTMAAVCLTHEEAAIGFTTAGRLLGYRGMTDPRVHVVVPHRLRLSFPGVVVHRTRILEPIDLTSRRPDGIRLTSPPRTLLDAAHIIGRDATESAIEQVLAERRLTLKTLVATGLRLYHAHRPGSPNFVDVVNGRPRWQRAARSELERRVREAIELAGLPMPIVNMRHRLASGEIIEIDLAFPEWRIAVEVDHPFWHAGHLAVVRDARRDRKLAREGWVTVRFPELEITTALLALVDDLAATLAQRGWRGTPVPLGVAS